jgi:hypothetical protein
MIDQQLARLRTHRSNIQRYRNLLKTSLTELERQFVQKRLTEERGGFDRTKAYKLIKRGKIIAYKMEGRTMVDADSIDAYHMTLPRIEPST